MEHPRLHIRFRGFPISGDQVKVLRYVLVFFFKDVVLALEKGLGQRYHLLRVVQRHVEQSAGAQQPPQLVKRFFHAGLVQPCQARLDQIPLDAGFESKPIENAGHVLNPQGSSEIRTRSSGELKVDVVLLRVGPAQYVHRGEMIAEARTQVHVIGRDKGIAGFTQPALLGHGAAHHGGHEVVSAHGDGAFPVDARVG